ncbi:MAG: ABC transporter permease [Candidatus Hydrogenedentota bacterium]|nr:MAG: ABC transporter permease [Candidatus Hydrogenedentota bacterium]
MVATFSSSFIASRSFFRQNKLSAAAAAVLGMVVLAAVVGPVAWPYSPTEINLDEALSPPSLSHPFGTDNHGRDVVARTIAGARISLCIGVAVTLLSLLLGTALGLLGGFFGRPVDSLAVVFTDVTLAFPSLLLAIAISVVIAPGFASVLIALSAVGWPTFARLSRSVVFSIKQTEYFSAAVASGCPSMRLVIKHVLPNCMPLLIVAASLRLGGFMLGEAALSFLGLGVQPPMASWGSMISHGRDFLHSAPWITIFPGIAIALTIVSMNSLGDSLRDYMDPKMRL